MPNYSELRNKKANPLIFRLESFSFRPVKGTLFTVQKALPLMSGGGTIVINGSMASIKGIPAFGVYAVTKAALRSFGRTSSVDLKGRNIRVNVVSPGTVITPSYKTAGLTDETDDRC